MNFRNIVEGTEAFKKLSKLQRELTLKRQNIQVIENGVHVANHLGREQWEKQSNFNHINKPIVEEIIEKKLVAPLKVKYETVSGIGTKEPQKLQYV